jgi:hypothetical protein
MGYESVKLYEAPLVEQQINPLPSCELALLVLLGDTIGTSALFGDRLAVVELVEEFSGVWHRGKI